jgi:hypothetical protein
LSKEGRDEGRKERRKKEFSSAQSNGRVPQQPQRASDENMIPFVL